MFCNTMQLPVERKWTDCKVDAHAFKEKCMQWVRGYSKYAILDTCGNTAYPESRFDVLFAVGARRFIQLAYGNAFDQLQNLIDESRDWLFGFLGYDLKNEVEDLHSDNPDRIGFPDLLFFVPEHIIVIKGNTVSIGSPEGKNIFKQILETGHNKEAAHTVVGQITHGVSMAEYVGNVKRIKTHIRNGDIYEMNYCFSMSAVQSVIDPVDCFRKLTAYSSPPFSALLQWDAFSIISGSPERFLRKTGSTVISQPIKGTVRRGNTPEEDAALRRQLADSEKDKAENVMIADLVRNDLTRYAVTGSVRVESLFEIMRFAHVYQMVSTIAAEMQQGIPVTNIIKHAFPMGSMTGAPKKMAMELIEHYENTKRSAYSGALGYFMPNGDFDLSVLIRSIFYNSALQYVAVHVGSAITWDSVAEAEYDECLLKAEALIAILQSGGNQ